MSALTYLSLSDIAAEPDIDAQADLVASMALEAWEILETDALTSPAA